MIKFKMNLQLFGEGGDGGAAESGGSEAGMAEEVAQATEKGRKSNPLENVVYGKASGEVADPSTEAKPAASKESKASMFENLIKGEYKDEFAKRTQGIINERFKETKQMQDTLKSHDGIMRMLADKYGTDASDVEALQKAIEDDESFYQQEAMEKGLTVKQLKEVKQLQRENEEFRRAEEEAQRKAHSQQIYSDWMRQGEELKAKYGLSDFDFRNEVNNPDFVNLLKSGISVESAYKTVHMDEMLSGAMQQTANRVTQDLAKSIGQRAARPKENGASTHNAATFKTDVNSLTKADRDEIERRVRRGEIISF